jgi:hypothetical protein
MKHLPLLKIALLFACVGGYAFASTVTCTGSDASAIQASLNAGGTTTLVGSCNIGTATIGTAANGTTLTTTTGASVTYTGSANALNINHNNVTVTNITWNGGGMVTTQTSMTTPQTGILIDSNVIQNITMANDNNVAILGNGYWSNGAITNNTIRTITSVPVGQITTSTNVENCSLPVHCTSDNYPCSWAGGVNNCKGSGITNVNGLDNMTIRNNHFDTILGNAMSLKYAWTLSATPGNFTSAANNNWSYNTAVNLHRMFEESGGVGSCPGGCLFGNTNKITNWKIAGNFATFIAPYGDTYGLSIPNNANAPQIVNNTFALTVNGAGAGFTYENGNQNELFQGNVASQPNGAGSWGQQNSSANQALGFTVFQQNNLFLGPVGTLAGQYYGGEGPNSPVPPYGGTFTNRFNLNGASCSGSCAASTLATAFITSGSPSSGCTANAASFPSGGNGTWCFYATNQISIVNVQFFIDGSSTPTVTQEIQDLSSTFTSDSRWQYHATISTTGLSGGSHTILATATDVSGATSSKSQTFTTGSGPGASFSPASLAFGTVTLGSSSSPQATTLTNTGTTTLTISGGVTITGANAGDFSKTTTCTATLAAAATCTVTVTFTPTALGPRVAFVTITDNAAGSPHQVQLTGGASLCLSGNILSQCDFPNGPNSLVTGGGPWGFNGGSFATVAVDNTGPGSSFAAHITVTAPISSGSNVELFQDGLTFPANGHMAQATLDCDASRPQLVNILGILSTSPFTSYGLAWMPSFPTSYGTHPNCASPFFKIVGSPSAGSGRVTAQADNSTTGDQLYMTNVNVVDVGTVPASQPSVTSVAFTPQNLGSTQTGTPFTITNGGIANLVISSITTTAQFGQTNTCGTITPGSTCTVTPTFTPSAIGSQIGSLFIASNDTSVSPQTIPLAGAGVGGEITAVIFPYVDHATASVGFQTRSNLSGFPSVIQIRYGAAPYDCTTGVGGTIQSTIDTGIAASYGAISIGGLAPSTAYSACPEPSTDGGATFQSGFGGTFTTKPLPAVHPSLPIKPIKFDTSYPDTTSYATPYNVLSDCSDFGTAYTTVLANWALSTPKGTVINVPPGTTCTTTTGTPFSFEGLPPDAFQFLPSAVNTSTSEITWTGHPFAEGDLVMFSRSYATLVTYPASTTCDVGYSTLNGGGIASGQHYQVHPTGPNTFQVYCLPDTQYDPAIPPPTPAIMQFTTQGSVTSPQHFYAVPFKQFLNTHDGLMEWKRVLPNGTPTPVPIVRSGAPDSQLPPEGTQITSAWASKMATFLDPATNATTTYPSAAKGFIFFGDLDANIEVPALWRLGPGIKITMADYNGSVHSSDPAGYSNVLVSYPWDSGLVYDRIWYHGLGAPNRLNVDMPWNGSFMAAIDSLWDNMTYFHANNVGLAPARASNTQFTIATGTPYTGFTPIPITSPVTCNISGSGSGTIFVYQNLLSSNAFTVAVPSGITATCTGISAVSASAGSPNGTCNASDAWPKTGNGEVTVAQIACITVSSGVIGTATAATPYVSIFNPEGDNHMIGGFGPGPYIFQNNFSSGAGIPWHYDASGGAAPRSGYTWYRNYLFTDPKYQTGSATSDGLRYYDRQHLEWKGGDEVDEQGNIVDTTWRDDTPDGTFEALTPLDGASIRDVNIQYNTFRHGSAVMEGINTTCPSDVPSSAPCARPAVRYRFQNNLVYDIDGYTYTSHNPGGSNGPGEGWNFQLYGVGDMIVDHNTYASNRGNFPLLFSFDGPAVEGYQQTGNIEWITGVSGQTPFTVASEIPLPPPGCTGLGNIALLNCGLTQGPGTTLYNFSQNLIAGGYTDSSVPSGQITTASMSSLLSGLNNSYLATGTVAGTTAAIGWSNPSIDNAASYCLVPGSSYKAGTNAFNKGADLGVNCNELAQAQGLLQLKGTPAASITTGGFSVSYIAADSAVVWVGYSTTNDITTATWVADSGGARARSTAITGLATKTHFYYWVLGPGNAIMSQRSGDTWTN